MGEKGNRKHYEPLLFNLLTCCLSLAASLVLCVYAWTSLSSNPAKKQSTNVASEKQRKIAKLHSLRNRKGACARRLTSLRWLARATIVCNVLMQVYYFEYFVLQRALFRGFNKNSPMHSICRLNSFFWHQPFIWLLCDLFWFQRLISTFNDNNLGTQSVSAPTIGAFYGCLFFQIVVWEMAAVFIALFVTSVIRLKSTDLDPYKGVNDNMVLCLMPADKYVFKAALGFLMFLSHLAINGFLAYKYVGQLKSVFANVRGRCTIQKETEQALVRKSVTVALVTTASSFLLFTVAVATDLWVLFPVETFLNTLCIVLYFRFASGKYQCLCGRIERCIMWSVPTVRQWELEVAMSQTRMQTIDL